MKYKVGFIVDSAGDHAALQSRFGKGYLVVKTGGPRDETMSVTQIVARSIKEMRILKSLGSRKIVMLVNFERKARNYRSFAERLSKECRESFAVTHLGVPVAVSVPNQVVENWYLADIEHLSAGSMLLKDNLKQRNYEGKDGKNELRKLFREKISYNEIQHGGKLFSIVRFDVARSNSMSFDHFLEAVEFSEE